jgi:hypothetical protein
MTICRSPRGEMLAIVGSASSADKVCAPGAGHSTVSNSGAISKRHVAVGVDEFCAPRQREHAEHVGRCGHVMMGAGRVAAIAVAREGELIEDGVERDPGSIGWLRQFEVARCIRAQRAGLRRGVARVPLFVVECDGERLGVHARILADVQTRQMKTERAHAPEQAPYGEPAGMHAAVRAQATCDQVDVADTKCAAGGRVRPLRRSRKRAHQRRRTRYACRRSAGPRRPSWSASGAGIRRCARRCWRRPARDDGLVRRASVASRARSDR